MIIFSKLGLFLALDSIVSKCHFQLCFVARNTPRNFTSALYCKSWPSNLNWGNSFEVLSYAICLSQVLWLVCLLPSSTITLEQSTLLTLDASLPQHHLNIFSFEHWIHTYMAYLCERGYVYGCVCVCVCVCVCMCVLEVMIKHEVLYVFCLYN